jgi:hydroxymethylpyrimidine pyrophosphatase-like HAD family hydrolase
MLGSGTELLSAERLPLPAGGSRGHLRALYRVHVREHESGAELERRVLVEGVGLGYLGRFTLDASTALERFSPRIYGLRDGLLYREWLDDEQRVGSLDGVDEEEAAAAIAAYARERRRQLPAVEDVTVRLQGQQPAWEVASVILSGVFGRAAPLARVLITDRAAKRMLRVERPSIVDGNTELGQWFFRDDSRSSLVKVNLGEHLFSNLGLSCFDPVFDLAGVGARAGTPSFNRSLRSAYAELAGEHVSDERWLLYELAHLWRRQRTQPHTEAELRRARARALQGYFSEVFLSDVTPAESGPLCALDVDGVLETEHLGFPSLSPASALALRALVVHGWRPLIATGRSAPEVAERCRAYGLAGGVAEYGAAIYDCRTGEVRSRLPDGAGEKLERLRHAFQKLDGVQLDDDYRFAVRAFRIRDGRRVGIDRTTVASVLARAGSDRIAAIEGEGQTDFVVRGVDKGTGVRALVGDQPLDLVVGDTAADAPLAPLAARAAAPAHGRAALHDRGFSVMSRPYQAGLAQAVAEALGHPPGGCELCRVPDPTPERRALLALLGLQERGRLGMASQALKAVLRAP